MEDAAKDVGLKYCRYLPERDKIVDVPSDTQATLGRVMRNVNIRVSFCFISSH